MEKNNSYILVTGGTGYIGSHTTLELLKLNHKVLIIDNLSNSSKTSLSRVKKLAQEYLESQGILLTQDEMDKRCLFEKIDIRIYEDLDELFTKYHIESVIHFAGLKAVGESVSMPLEYYEVNIYGTIQLLKVMKKHEVYSLVFSSSASVYGNVKKEDTPIVEELVGIPLSPYGGSKLMNERVMKDLYISEKDKWRFVMLRYFNPVCYFLWRD